MYDLYLIVKTKKRMSRNQLERMGLMKAGINLADLDIIPLEITHDIDTELYTPVDTGQEDIKNGKAFVIYEARPKDVPDIRLTMKEKVHGLRDTILVAGIAFAFDGATHKLQTRDATELVNWMSTYTKAQTLPSDTPIKVRTEADKSLFIPAGKMVVLLDHMITYRTEVMDASWAIKDAIDQASTNAAAFTAYESGIKTEWPDAGPKQL